MTAITYSGEALAIAAPKLPSGDEALAKIEIGGVEGDLEKNIRARLPAFRPKCSADIESLYKYKKSLLRKINKASRSLGYYHVKSNFNAIKGKGCWVLSVTIEAGKPLRVIKQQIVISGEGRTNPIFTSIKKPYSINDPLNHAHYKDYKSQLETAAQENGYLAATFTKKEILVNLANNTAQITLHFNTGSRYHFGKVHVNQEILDDKYLNRYLLIKEDEFFTSLRLIEQQQLFQSSGYYSSVNINADYKQAINNRVPINIVLTSKKRNHFQGKFGYGTDTGIRTRFSMNRRWTGSAGKKLNVSLGLSQRINDLSIQWTIPKNNPLKNNTVTFLNLKDEDTDDLFSRSFKFGVIGTSLTDRGWVRSLSLTHLLDTTQIKGEEKVTSGLTLLGIQYAKTRAKDRLFPKHGWRMRLSAEGALDAILSDASLLQLKAHVKHVSSIGKARFIKRADMGITLGDRLDNLPKDLRFFSGGINHIRGYNYESLGEINSTGTTIGGRKLLELSLELDYPITEKWSIAGFVDAGNSFDNFNSSDIKVGVGAGVRWHSPIGPVRLDLASPSDNLSDVHIHLSIGPDL